MSGFRLYSLAIDNKLISSDRITLVNDSDSVYDNYFSLIIGNNGTGKSRLLSEITRFFKDLTQDNTQINLFNDARFKYNCIPSKVIAITNSIFR